MLSFAPDLHSLRARGAIDSGRAETLLRIERREVLSLHYEIRIAAWIAVALLATAVGAILKTNLERIGPLTIALILAAAAAVLYLYALTKKRRNAYTILDGYLAFLAALLVSADAGYVEQQFDLFGARGFDHLAILAVIHASFAYLLGSKLILSLSLSALAAWFGIDRQLHTLLDTPLEIGMQALLCSAVIVVWRVVHRRTSSQRELDSPFEHFAVNLVGIGAVAFAADRSAELSALALLSLFGAGAGWLAVKRRSEMFVLYALLYTVIGVSTIVVRHLDDQVLITLYLLFAFATAITTLFIVHMRWRFDD